MHVRFALLTLLKSLNQIFNSVEYHNSFRVGPQLMHIFLTIDGMTTTQYVCFILFLFFEPFIKDLFTDGTKMMLENELWKKDYKDIMAPSTFLF